MILLTHIIIALGSLAYTTKLYFWPKTSSFTAAYVLIGATLASGTWLVVASHSQILSACTTGLTYLAIVSVGIAAAHHKLSANS